LHAIQSQTLSWSLLHVVWEPCYLATGTMFETYIGTVIVFHYTRSSCSFCPPIYEGFFSCSKDSCVARLMSLCVSKSQTTCNDSRL